MTINRDSAAIVVAAAVTLFLKGLVLSYVQVAARYRARSFSRPEDARLLGLKPQAEPDLVHRVASALRNEAENSPAFLAIAAGYVLLGGTARPLLYVTTIYVVARLLQGYSQIRALQPHRMIGYLVGAAATLSLAVMIAFRLGA